MSSDRCHGPLRGGCQCGRLTYVVQVPKDHRSSATVTFHTGRTPRFPPLRAFLRVPLPWYQSTTHAYLPDENPSLIHKIYSHPLQGYAQRHFCGVCGTPVAYWSEMPRPEADFICLTLESLSPEDLHDIEERGMVPQPDYQLPSTPCSATADNAANEALRVNTESTSVGWVEDLMEGSVLGRLHRKRAASTFADSGARVEWEVVEYSDDAEDADMDVRIAGAQGALAKCAMANRDDSELPRRISMVQ